MAKKIAASNESQDSGTRGGKRRWHGVSPEERSAIMQRVARARWGPKKKAKPKNRIAAQLVKLRWEKLTPEQRKEAMRKVRAKRKPS